LFFVFVWQLLSPKKNNDILTRLNFLLDKKNKAFWVFWLFIAYWGLFFLATIFSLDFRFSFFGSPYRAGGFLNFSFYFIFAIVIFLVLKNKDWQKIWDFSIIIGILVCLFAYIQISHLNLPYVIHFSDRPPSTIGGSTFLASYILLLTFITFCFGAVERKTWKKIFYFISAALFAITIIVILMRAAYGALVFGSLFFILFYPKKFRLSKIFKISFFALLILLFLGFYFLKTHPDVRLFKQGTRLQKITNMVISIYSYGTEGSRISSWRVLSRSLKERPVLGYGPENISIAFDKHYDPSLPSIAINEGMHSSWWDRAHNFFLDISVQAGVPALIIFLLFISFLFYQLQRLKAADKNADGNADKTPRLKIIAHGIQSTLLAYLVVNLFSFDIFSISLIFFLMTGFSFYLLSNNAQPQAIRFRINQFSAEKWRGPVIFIAFLILVWFLWSWNIRPFKINTQINIAQILVNQKECDAALSRMDKVLGKRSFLDVYLRLKYADLLKSCEPVTGKTLEYAQKGRELTKESVRIQPYYVRNWILLDGYTNVLIEKEKNPEIKKELIKEANSYLEKAYELSPKRQELYLEWTKAALVADEYPKAKEKAEKCVSVNKKLPDCYWFLGLSEIALGDLQNGQMNLIKATEMGYNSRAITSLHQLVKIYSATKNYPELAKVYEDLVWQRPKEPQYHASLAFTYKELGEYELARREAMKVLELQPEAKEEVEAFLKTLPR
jgi:putative inorganic carbon (HCO3(-)) transporter